MRHVRKWIGTILLLAGSAALVWCLTVLAGAALFQWYESRHLARGAPVPRTAHIPRKHEVIGELEIPRLHLSTVVLEGDDDFALRLGAGHVPDTALPGHPGNFSIAAHRDTFFRPLRTTRPGDRISLMTRDGSYTYAVQSTEIVHPDDSRVLDASGGEQLTLITCYPFYYIGAAPLRFIVHAIRTSDAQSAQSIAALATAREKARDVVRSERSRDHEPPDSDTRGMFRYRPPPCDSDSPPTPQPRNTLFPHR